MAKPIQHRDIPYLSPKSTGYDKERHLLDVYVPDTLNEKTAVAVFIHGGKWQLGNKNTYRFLGKKLARHNVVTVIINYRLSPAAPDYSVMAMDCANAVKWVYEHIEEYGGDKNKIYLYGHSSGAHLSALIAMNNCFFDSTGIANPVKGCVLIDPFGLTIETYLHSVPKKHEWMYTIFTKNPEVWKDAAPVNFIKEDSLRFLIYTGVNSPARIQKDGAQFYEAVAKKNKDVTLARLYNVGHLTIIFQLYYTKNRLYKDFVSFMNP